METKDKLSITAITTLLLLLAGSVFISPGEIDNAYYCDLSGDVGVFHRLSTSGKTGYYFDESQNEVKVSCRTGRTYEPWQNLNTYAESIGIDAQTLIARSGTAGTDVFEPDKGDFICSAKGCEVA